MEHLEVQYIDFLSPSLFLTLSLSIHQAVTTAFDGHWRKQDRSHQNWQLASSGSKIQPNLMLRTPTCYNELRKDHI